MLETAVKNGIKPSTYYERVRRGWSKDDAATKPLVKYYGEFAVYRGDDMVAVGTAEECAKELGVSSEYIRWMTTPYGRKLTNNRQNPSRATTAVKLDDSF